MTQDDDLRIRAGRIHMSRSQRAKPFITQALATAEKAGGMTRRPSTSRQTGAFGRGRAASLSAARRLTDRSRVTVIKARFVRHGMKRAPLYAHLAYLRSDGVTKDGEQTRMFGAESDDVDHKAFAERCEGDRHHRGRTVLFLCVSGDGLNDIVRVRNGEVCYWPNIGYGRFGAKVTMDRAPRFDNEERFDPRRIRLADIDGTGTADLLSIGEDGVRAWFNQSGNSWSVANPIAVFPTADQLSTVQAIDLLGIGTACLVWSSPLPAQARSPLLYVDLMGSQKPHLMISAQNNLGAETRVTYASSTRFYLKDRAAGRPWVTRLPFPVHVAERVETTDWVGRNRLVSRYAYHHGYFDGYEREFRGFGMVEQWDTEEFRADTAFTDDDFVNWNKQSWSPLS